MGRQPWTSRLTVEKCPIQWSISIHRGKLCPGSSGTLSWNSIPDGSFLGRLKYEIHAGGPAGRAIFFPRQFFCVGGTFCEGGSQTIPLSTTRPHLGGNRFWFVCGCGRRSGKLYLPSGETVFRCRRCYDLTYESAQQHSKELDELRRALRWVHGGNR